MSDLTARITIACGFIALDAIAFVIPFGSLFIGYILIWRPPWFLNMVIELYELKNEEKNGK